MTNKDFALLISRKKEPLTYCRGGVNWRKKRAGYLKRAVPTSVRKDDQKPGMRSLNIQLGKRSEGSLKAPRKELTNFRQQGKCINLTPSPKKGFSKFCGLWQGKVIIQGTDRTSSDTPLARFLTKRKLPGAWGVVKQETDLPEESRKIRGWVHSSRQGGGNVLSYGFGKGNQKKEGEFSGQFSKKLPSKFLGLSGG